MRRRKKALDLRPRLLAFLLLLLFPAILLAEPTLSGANYWGDSSNAVIDGPDISQLKQLLGGVAVSYPTIAPNSRERSKYWQDVSGSGVIDGPDLSILKNWLAGNYGDLSGNPSLLENETVTATVVAGDSVTLGARGKSGFNWYRAGWGLNFQIVSSTCVGAQLYGRDPAGSKTYILSGEVYEYTNDPPPLDDGYARVKVFAPGSCTTGQQIVVEVSVPADSYSGAPNNRHPDKLTAIDWDGSSGTLQNVIITVVDNPPDTFIDSGPVAYTASRDASFTFHCNESSCTYQCQLDTTSWPSCSSPATYSGLFDGSHTFEVRAIDSSLQPDPTPAQVTWTIDTISPTMTIQQPGIDAAFTDPAVAVGATYSDVGTGINPASFTAVLNGATVTGSFTATSSQAGGTIAGVNGQNILTLTISDYAGNSRQSTVPFYVDISGTPPVVTIISPADGSTISTDTPLLKAEFYDDEAGINLLTLQIKVDNIDMTSEFIIESVGDRLEASYQLTAENALPVGWHNITVTVSNYLGLPQVATGDFFVLFMLIHPWIDSVAPPVAMPGDTLIITGVNFSSTVDENYVLFVPTGTAEPINFSATQLTVIVPDNAQSGSLYALVKGMHSNRVNFALGLRHGFVANWDNGFVTNPSATKTVSVITFDMVSPGTVLNGLSVTGSLRPFDAALSPDAGILYVTDYGANRVDFYNAFQARGPGNGSFLGSITGIPSPRNLKVSPDGLEVYVGSGNGNLYVIRNNVLRTPPLTIGLTVNEIAIAPVLQKMFVASAGLSSQVGKVKYFSLDKSGNYLSGNTVTGTAYRGQTGVCIKPDQSEVYVANNYSNNSTEVYSFSILDATATAFERTQDCDILPTTDRHDISRPYDVIFDPLGQLFYASFSGSAAAAPELPTNNIGAQKWRAASGNFDGASYSDTVIPTTTPRGMAFSPGGKLLFAANFGTGSGAGNGSNLTILDHAKVKLAIDSDPTDGTYNLTGTNPETFEDLNVLSGHPQFDKLLRTTGQNFDGPQNVCFQEFPMLQLSRPVYHLATGGQAGEQGDVSFKVNPIYGNTIAVGLDSGATVRLFKGDTGDFHQMWLAPDRENLFAIGDTTDVVKVTLTGSTPGIGEIIANAHGYPSNVAFVTIPPQEFIGILFAEACDSGGDITHRALAAVVKNRIRLTKHGFDHPSPNIATVSYGFPPSLANGGTQIRAINATEESAADQLLHSITQAQFASVRPTCLDSSTARYCYAQKFSRVPTASKASYNNSVVVAGDAILDLLRTLTNDTSMWDIPTPDPNYLDLTPDPSGGSFFFYSPNDTEWGNTTTANSIKGTLISGSATFPTAGGFESTVCGVMASNFCDGDPKHANYLQVVVINSIPLNNCSGGSYDKSPQFIFMRWRDSGDHAVIFVP